MKFYYITKPKSKKRSLAVADGESYVRGGFRLKDAALTTKEVDLATAVSSLYRYCFNYSSPADGVRSIVAEINREFGTTRSRTDTTYSTFSRYYGELKNEAV